MNIYKNFTDLALGIGKKDYEVMEAWERWLGRSYMYVGDIEVMTHIIGNDVHFVVFDSQDNKDCKEYMMNYEVEEYKWKVYVDDFEGWQNCKVIDINNTRLGINRATVICESGTQLNRVVKFVLDEYDEDFKPDRCVYYMEKE